MRYFKRLIIPCTTAVPEIQKVAAARGCTLIACNEVDINDFCEEERAYTGNDPQELLFLIPATGEAIAERKLTAIKSALAR